MFTNFGRELVFSADLCYNGANRKPPSEREVARRSRDGRSLRDFEVLISFIVTRSPSPDFVVSSLPEGAKTATSPNVSPNYSTNPNLKITSASRAERGSLRLCYGHIT